MGVYDKVGGLIPGRSAFDRSHTVLTDADMGVLVPIFIDEVLPGDVVDLYNQNIIRSQPLVTPIYHRLAAYCHYFFVPWRIVCKEWERFISGGRSGDETVTLPQLGWESFASNPAGYRVTRYGLYDYFGLPMFNPSTGVAVDSKAFQPTDINDLYWRAYWAIWRDYFRDSNHQYEYPQSQHLSGLLPAATPVGEDPDEMIDNLAAYVQSFTDEGELIADRPAYRCWSKDYFTSALPWQQRGTGPAVPLAGTANAQWPTSRFMLAPPDIPVGTSSSASTGILQINNANARQNAQDFFNSNTITWGASGIDIADLRFAVQTEKWMERNARAGYRYNEFLKAHFGVAPSDSTLQRPEYIGGTRQPVIISEVIQNSQTDTTPQGNMAGHGMSVGEGRVGRYRVQEFGCIIGMMSIMPEAIYQQGVPRMFTRRTRFDHYFPEFAHLSEQEIYNQEIFYQNEDMLGDHGRFGFQGAWDEYRNRQSYVTGKLASSLNMWHLSRNFAELPELNPDFLTTEQFVRSRRNAWAVTGVQSNLQGEFLIQWRNIVKMVRPMPYISDPGMMDHF